MDDAVVITGVGLVCSLGGSMEQVWNALLAGAGGIRPIEGFDAQGFDCRVAAQVHALNIDPGVQPRLAGIMDKHLSMLMKCTGDALEQCNLQDVPREEIAFFAGMGMVDYEIPDLLRAVSKSMDPEGRLNYDTFYSEGYREIYPLWPLAMLNNVSFCQVAVKLDIRGENVVFCPHADSGAEAIAEGVNTILERRARVALAGGVSEKVSPASLARAHLSGMLSTARSGNDVWCRPFAADRNGAVLGEGCGMLALELRSAAEARGAPCLAVVSGSGFACDVQTDSHVPTIGAISGAMQQALINAELRPRDVDLVIAHGDGTHLGDKNEIAALHRVFADCIQDLRVYTSKGALGHLFAASPAVDTVLAISMLKNKVIPPPLTSIPIDPDIKFNLAYGPLLETLPRRIMINSSSYEGQCASLIVEAYD